MQQARNGVTLLMSFEGVPGTGRDGQVDPDALRPKLRLVRSAVSRLAWCFACGAGWRSDYFKVSGIGVPMRSKASRWALVGSASMVTVALVPAKRTWLRVRVARCSSRLRKLR